MSRSGSNRWGADGIRMDTFPWIHYVADSRRDPEHDIFWREGGNEELCIANSKTAAEYARRFAHVGLDQKRIGKGLIPTNRTENGIMSLRT